MGSVHLLTSDTTRIIKTSIIKINYLIERKKKNNLSGLILLLKILKQERKIKINGDLPWFKIEIWFEELIKNKKKFYVKKKKLLRILNYSSLKSVWIIKNHKKFKKLLFPLHLLNLLCHNQSPSIKIRVKIKKKIRYL